MNDNKKIMFGVVSLILVLLIILLVVYYTNGNKGYEIQSAKIPSTQESLEDAKDMHIAGLKSELEHTQKLNQSNTLKDLRYVIYPEDSILSICLNQEIGKWQIPSKCAEELIQNTEKLIQNNHNIVAIEISGVVDNHPYRGLSPELKQKGLGSFRALEAINILTNAFPNLAIFEGISLQQDNKRGFVSRAFYVKDNK